FYQNQKSVGIRTTLKPVLDLLTYGGLLDMTSRIDQLVTSKSELVNRKTSNKLTSLDIQIRALEIARGLTSKVEPNEMKAWYCKTYKAIGEGRYTMIAQTARRGNSPKALFGWLLKQELNKIYE